MSPYGWGCAATLLLVAAIASGQTPTPGWTAMPDSFLVPGGQATITAPSEPGTYWLHLRYEYTDAEGKQQVTFASQPFRVHAGFGFYTIAACRLFDTRIIGDALMAGTPRTYAVNEGCGIPSNVGALAVNITVTQPTSAGHLALFPAGTPEPGVSTINYKAGQTRANNAILPLGPEATFTVACRQPVGSVHFILDVVGYFETPPVMPPGESSSNAVVTAALAALGALGLLGGGYWLSRKRTA